MWLRAAGALQAKRSSPSMIEQAWRPPSGQLRVLEVAQPEAAGARDHEFQGRAPAVAHRAAHRQRAPQAREASAILVWLVRPCESRSSPRAYRVVAESPPSRRT